MRIRSIKPEFWRSPDIDSLDWNQRLIFIGLWSYVDDNGVGDGRVASIAADLFASDLSVDPTETLRRVSLSLDEFESRGMVIRYKSGSRPLVYVTNWDSHQLVKNPSKGNCYPIPPAETVKSSRTLRRVYGESTETLGTGAGEQGSSRTGEQGSSSSSSEKSDDAVIEDPAIESLCEHLADRIEANGSPRPKISKKWRDSARLMMSNDQRTYDQIRFAIDWSQGDEFWRSNVLSMPKLREKFDQMRLSAQRNRPQGRSTTDDRVRGHLALAAEFAARETNTDQLEITS